MIILSIMATLDNQLIIENPIKIIKKDIEVREGKGVANKNLI